MTETQVVNSQANKPEAKAEKKKFKMPSSLTIIIGVLFAVVIMTWIASWAGASYITYDDDGKEVKTLVNAAGLFGGLDAITGGFLDGGSLIFYLFVLGAVIELMLVSGALEAGISSLVKGFNGKELFLIPLLVFLFSAGGTIYGMQEETIALYVIIVPALALAGFDTVTGLLVILLGTTTGFSMSIVNPFSIGSAQDAMASTALASDWLIVFTAVWWFIITCAVSGFITGYAMMVKKNPERSVSKEMKAESDEWLNNFRRGEGEDLKANGRQKAALGIFMTAFALMVLLFIPWTALFDFDNTLPTWTDFLFGGVAGIGDWYFAELSMMFIFVGAILAIILKQDIMANGATVSDTMWSGAKEMFSVAIIIGVARAIPVVLTATGTQDWMVQGMNAGLHDMSALGYGIVSFFLFIILALLIPSTSGLAAASIGIFTAVSANIGADGVAATSAVLVAFMLATGIVNMFVPTQAIVMASCSSAKVSYIDAMKVVLVWAGIMIVLGVFIVASAALIL